MKTRMIRISRSGSLIRKQKERTNRKVLIPIPTKKKPKTTLEIIGGNAEDVTGSATLITCNKKQSLFEFGMIQRGKTPYENYQLNKELLSSVRPSKIQNIFVGHCHCDHIGMIPALYKKSCSATIYVPKGSYLILQEMWNDSAYINCRDAEVMSAQREKPVLPLFTEDDVTLALQHICEVDFHELHQVDDDISIRFSYAGHILFSAQTELFISENNHFKKILFTSDLGNLKLDKPFVESFEPVSSANIVIGEATYASPKRTVTDKDHLTDLTKIKTVIRQYCQETRGNVLIPCFALDRLPYMLWILHNIFADEEFTVPVVVDSPLGIRLLQAYQKVLPEQMQEPFREMLAWKNLRFTADPSESKAAMADPTPKIVLASSGMLTAGRSVKWTQKILPQAESCILFIGYAATNTLGYKIKNGLSTKTITINGKECKNNAAIVDLHSFSSHMQRDDLLDYYSSIRAEKIYLVHSNMDDRLVFKADLEKVLGDQCRSTRVIAVNKGMKITI